MNAGILRAALCLALLAGQLVSFGFVGNRRFRWRNSERKEGNDMKTRYETMSSGGIDSYANFIGDDTEYKDWFNVIGRHRDSGCLEESNFDMALRMMGGEGDNVRVERFGHWAVGWIEEVYVRPGTREAGIAEEIERALEDYPVLDEEDFSRREHDAAQETWERGYRVKDRIALIRRFRHHFEFHDLADLLGCVRGKWYCGDTSLILHD